MPSTLNVEVESWYEWFEWNEWSKLLMCLVLIVYRLSLDPYEDEYVASPMENIICDPFLDELV